VLRLILLLFKMGLPKKGNPVPKLVGVLIHVMNCLLKCICWWIFWLHKYAQYE